MGNSYDLGYTASEAVTENLGAAFTGAGESKVKICGASDVPLGIFQCDGNADETVTVRLSGPALAISGGAFGEGADLKFDANGKVVAAGDPTFPTTAAVQVIGHALQPADGADEIVEIFIEKSVKNV